MFSGKISRRSFFGVGVAAAAVPVVGVAASPAPVLGSAADAYEAAVRIFSQGFPKELLFSDRAQYWVTARREVEFEEGYTRVEP